MTQEDLIEMFPWMAELELRDNCSCGASIGEQHYCDYARCKVCKGQLIACDCRTWGDGEDWNEVIEDNSIADRWMGTVYPNLHRICIEQGFYCRDMVQLQMGTVPLPDDNFELRICLSRQPGCKVLFHQECEKGDYGWGYDLNRAGVWEVTRQEYDERLY